jgi:hypothetical protein
MTYLMFSRSGENRGRDDGKGPDIEVGHGCGRGSGSGGRDIVGTAPTTAK